LCDRNWYHAVQVVALALEKRVIFDVQHNVQVADRATELSDFARPGETDSRSVFHPGGNLRVHRALSQDASFSLALRARIGNHAACALAGRTRTSNAEKSLLVANLATAAARAAGGWSF